jgi:hypothetical protein
MSHRLAPERCPHGCWSASPVVRRQAGAPPQPAADIAGVLPKIPFPKSTTASLTRLDAVEKLRRLSATIRALSLSNSASTAVRTMSDTSPSRVRSSSTDNVCSRRWSLATSSHTHVSTSHLSIGSYFSTDIVAQGGRQGHLLSRYAVERQHGRTPGHKARLDVRARRKPKASRACPARCPGWGNGLPPEDITTDDAAVQFGDDHVIARMGEPSRNVGDCPLGSGRVRGKPIVLRNGLILIHFANVGMVEYQQISQVLSARLSHYRAHHVDRL